jgi:hypothetical protein
MRNLFIMGPKNDFDAQAALIQSEIAKKGFHHLNKVDLEFIWHFAPSLPEREKWLQVQNFALTYGFKAHVFANSQSVIFHVAE